MPYNGNIRKPGKYAAGAGIALSLIAGACDVGMVKQPSENAAVLAVDYDCAREKCGGSFWDVVNHWLKTEGQPHSMTEPTEEGSLIIGRYNPSLKNPFLYKGKLRLPDLDGDGKFSPELMKCGTIESPFRNLPYVDRDFMLPRKTIPRSGKR